MVDTKMVSEAGYKWLVSRKSRSFYSIVSATSLRSGVQALLQVYTC